MKKQAFVLGMQNFYNLRVLVNLPEGTIEIAHPFPEQFLQALRSDKDLRFLNNGQFLRIGKNLKDIIVQNDL